jgi:hypothetical protein
MPPINASDLLLPSREGDFLFRHLHHLKIKVRLFLVCFIKIIKKSLSFVNVGVQSNEETMVLPLLKIIVDSIILELFYFIAV